MLGQITFRNASGLKKCLWIEECLYFGWRKNS